MSPAAAAALAAAGEQLAAGRPAACLAVLAALAPDQREALPARRLQALCHIQLAGDAGYAASVGSAWWKVFGLEAQHASAADVRRQFRRLSALVHPDKCRLEGSHQAFQRLQAAAEALQRAVEEGSGDAAPRPGKRPRTAGGRSGGRGAASGGDEEEEEEEEEDGWVPDGGGFPWWSEWDAPAAQRGQQETQQGSAQQMSAQQAQLGQETQQVAGNAADAAGPAAQTEEQQDEEQLRAMDLDALRAEVRRRQAGLLEPQVDAEGRRIPLPQLQAALRRARSVLAGRVAAAAEQRAAASDGGFLR